MKELADKSGFGINGDVKKVSLLNGDKWYEDPVSAIE